MPCGKSGFHRNWQTPLPSHKLMLNRAHCNNTLLHRKRVTFDVVDCDSRNGTVSSVAGRSSHTKAVRSTAPTPMRSSDDPMSLSHASTSSLQPVRLAILYWNDSLLSCASVHTGFLPPLVTTPLVHVPNMSPVLDTSVALMYGS